MENERFGLETDKTRLSPSLSADTLRLNCKRNVTCKPLARLMDVDVFSTFSPVIDFHVDVSPKPFSDTHGKTLILCFFAKFHCERFRTIRSEYVSIDCPRQRSYAVCLTVII